MVQMVERQTCGPTLRGWQDKIPGFGDYSKKIDYSPIGTFKSGSLDFSKAFGFSAGGKMPNNLKPFFIGGIFKGIKKAFSGVVKAVSSVVSGVGNFLNSPLGSILTTAISFVPGFQWVAPVVKVSRQQVRLLRVILWVPSPIRLVP